jgi:hypothetical protein
MGDNPMLQEGGSGMGAMLPADAPQGWLIGITVCAVVSTMIPMSLLVQQLVRSISGSGSTEPFAASPSEEPEAGSALIRGKRFKVLFLSMLTASNLFRFIFYLIQTVGSRVQFNLVWTEVLFVIPPLLFFSTFSVILCFWYQLISASTSPVDADENKPSRFFLGLNVFVYSSLLVIGFASDNIGLSFCLIFLGAVDLLAAFGCSVYGVVLSR